MDNSLNRQRVINLVSELVRLPREELDTDTNLATIGLDSLQRVALIDALEFEVGVPLSDRTVEELLLGATIGEIFQALEARSYD